MHLLGHEIFDVCVALEFVTIPWLSLSQGHTQVLPSGGLVRFLRLFRGGYWKDLRLVASFF